MKDVIISLLSSKKAVVLVLSVVAMGAARIGWNVDAEQLYLFIAPVLAYLLAQGWADRGKAAAEVVAEASKEPASPS